MNMKEIAVTLGKALAGHSYRTGSPSLDEVRAIAASFHHFSDAQRGKHGFMKIVVDSYTEHRNQLNELNTVK